MNQYATGNVKVKCEACNKNEMDSHGDHALNCTSDFGLAYRHRGVQKLLFNLVKENNIQVQQEVAAPESNSGLRPGDIYLPIGFDGGAPMYIDLTIVNPTSSSYVDHSKDQPNHFLNSCVEAKKNKYKQLFSTKGYTESCFMPFAMDVYGTIHPEAETILLNVAKIGAHFHNATIHKRLNYCRLKIQFCLAKCIAAQIQTKTPKFLNASNSQQDSEEWCSNPVTSGWN